VATGGFGLRQIDLGYGRLAWFGDELLIQGIK